MTQTGLLCRKDLSLAVYDRDWNVMQKEVRLGVSDIDWTVLQERFKFCGL
jgi:hypothetical protein